MTSYNVTLSNPRLVAFVERSSRMLGLPRAKIIRLCVEHCCDDYKMLQDIEIRYAEAQALKRKAQARKRSSGEHIISRRKAATGR